MSLTVNYSPADIAEVLRYDPETGKLYWLHRPASMFEDSKTRIAQGVANIWNARYAGKEAFTTSGARGLLQGSLFGKPAKAHRIAWAIHYGEWPGEIDHIDGDPSNNRISNLRDVLHTANGKNQKRYATNSSGVSGVAWYKPLGKWLARLGSPNTSRYRHLGYFEHKFDAILARLIAEKSAGYHENHGRA